METGRTASARDLKEAEDIIFKTFRE